jgi:hypothetical protein
LATNTTLVELQYARVYRSHAYSITTNGLSADDAKNIADALISNERSALEVLE